MREILFRGQIRRDGEKIKAGNGELLPGKWVYGGIFAPEIQDSDYSVIYSYDSAEKFMVYADTVGQYTGLTDKNGTKIFEGDIVEMPAYAGGKHRAVVYFKNGKFAVDGSNYAFKDICPKRMTVIGNIHDNKFEV